MKNAIDTGSPARRVVAALYEPLGAGAGTVAATARLVVRLSKYVLIDSVTAAGDAAYGLRAKVRRRMRRRR